MSIRVTFRAFKPIMLNINTTTLEAEAKNLIQDHLNMVVKEVNVYPPARAHRANGLWYHRTKGLSKGWRTQTGRRAGDFIGSIYNTQSYATYVVGPYQTEMHRQQGWPRLDEHLHRDIFRKNVLAFNKRIFKR